MEKREERRERRLQAAKAAIIMQFFDLHWHKDQHTGSWCCLNSKLVNDSRLTSFDDVGVPGIYIIWAGIANRTILYVGEGLLNVRFNYHLNSSKIQSYHSQGLYATWATTIPSSAILRKRIEIYLLIMLDPVLNKRLPNNVLHPILVNLPEWEKNIADIQP